MNCKWIHNPEIASEVLREIVELTKDKKIDDSIEFIDNKEILMGIKKRVEKKLGKDNSV